MWAAVLEMKWWLCYDFNSLHHVEWGCSRRTVSFSVSFLFIYFFCLFCCHPLRMLLRFRLVREMNEMTFLCFMSSNRRMNTHLLLVAGGMVMALVIVAHRVLSHRLFSPSPFLCQKTLKKILFIQLLRFQINKRKFRIMRRQSSKAKMKARR